MASVIHSSALLDITKALCTWARYRGQARLIPFRAEETWWTPPAGQDCLVLAERWDAAGAPLAFAVFVEQRTVDAIRKDWEHGREIDSIPSNDEIAAYLVAKAKALWAWHHEEPAR